MPWCPVCKNEYREGIAECAECKVPLVDDLSECSEYANSVELFSIEKESFVEKFVKYLEYSGITSAEIKFNEENELYYVYISENDYEMAAKHLKIFAMAERENEMYGECVDEDSFEETDEFAESDENEDSEEFSDEEFSDDAFDDAEDISFFERHEDDEPAPAEFVRKSEQYSDYKFSAYSCMIVGIAGLAFTILNMMGIIELITVAFSQWVMLIVFALFFAGGIWMYLKSNSIQTLIADEDSSINEINEWLVANITAESYEAFADADTPSEINYLDYTNHVKEKAFDTFPEMNPSMIDSLVDEHLDKTI